MLLADSEIRRSLDRVKAAFPNFSDWDHNNENNESYSGFSVWGEYVPEPNDPMAQRFFVTFDCEKARWTGHLTVGKHCYYWSSADFGDAHLLDTSPCATLEDSIATLKSLISALFAALSA